MTGSILTGSFVFSSLIQPASALMVSTYSLESDSLNIYETASDHWLSASYITGAGIINTTFRGSAISVAEISPFSFRVSFTLLVCMFMAYSYASCFSFTMISSFKELLFKVYRISVLGNTSSYKTSDDNFFSLVNFSSPFSTVTKSGFFTTASFCVSVVLCFASVPATFQLI